MEDILSAIIFVARWNPIGS